MQKSLISYTLTLVLEDKTLEELRLVYMVMLYQRLLRISNSYVRANQALGTKDLFSTG